MAASEVPGPLTWARSSTRKLKLDSMRVPTDTVCVAVALLVPSLAVHSMTDVPTPSAVELPVNGVPLTATPFTDTTRPVIAGGLTQLSAAVGDPSDTVPLARHCV